jgi:proteasome beta subunit
MEQELKNNILKSGTSLVGIVCRDGIIMAGDRRTTAGNMILNKNKQKVVQITDYLVISGTGSVSDTEMLKKIVKAELKLKELKSKRRPTVQEAANLIANISYRNIRQPSMLIFMAGIMLGGVNEDGTVELYSIEPAGSAQKVDRFDANFSSGMPFIMGLLERQYRKDITIADGIELAIEALKSSTQIDIASGNGIDVFAITKEGIKHVISQEIAPDYKDNY